VTHLDADEGEVIWGAGAVDVDEGGGEEDAHVAGRGGDNLVVVTAVDAGEAVRLERIHVRGADVILHLQGRHVVAIARAVTVAVGVDGGDGRLDLHANHLTRHGGRQRGWGRGVLVEVAAVGAAAMDIAKVIGLLGHAGARLLALQAEDCLVAADITGRAFAAGRLTEALIAEAPRPARADRSSAESACGILCARRAARSIGRQRAQLTWNVPRETGPCRWAGGG
jgi:hypothetical protein